MVVVVPKCVNITIKLKDAELVKFESASVTKDVLTKTLRHSSVNLKISKITTVSHNKSVRIRATEANIEALKNCKKLDCRIAGLYKREAQTASRDNWCAF